jgi:tubulin---tyrosine ligase
MTVYLYTRILALFSSAPYHHPSQQPSSALNDPDELAPHLTNSSLQIHRGDAGVRMLDELAGCHILSSSQTGVFSERDVDCILREIASVLAETFHAALANPVHFQVSMNVVNIHLAHTDSLCHNSRYLTPLNCTALILWSLILWVEMIRRQNSSVTCWR